MFHCIIVFVSKFSSKRSTPKLYVICVTWL